jgi:hypothetical protein
MSSDLIIGGLLGIIAAMFMGLTLGAIIGAIYFFTNKDYKYKIRVRNMSGGKAVIEILKGKRMKHPLLGECYYVPALKSQKRHILPYHGSAYEMPISGKKWFVPFTYYDGEYTPELYDPFSGEEELDKIVRKQDLTPDELAKLSDKERDDAFFKVRRKVRVFILRPVNKAIRKWVLDADRAIEQENMLKLNWFERNKDFIMLTVMCLIAGVVCFMMILFSAQYGMHVIDHPAATPQWAIDMLNASLNATGMPRLG